MTASRPALAATRTALHQVAEHVLAAGQYAATGSIRLQAVPGGFGTTRLLPGERTLAVAHARLVVRWGGIEQVHPLTTLRELARAADVPLGMPPTVYTPATPLDPDTPLSVDEEDAYLLANWYGLADAALRQFGAGAEPVIWPEHFDIGIAVDEVNYGASPGDAEFAEPYLYVGPHGGAPARDEFWNASFGAARGIAEVQSVDDAVEFFEAGRERVTNPTEAGPHL